MSDPRIDLTIEGDIAYLTVDRVDKHNALDASMMGALGTRCREIEHSSARAVILSGAGEKSFCAGGDIAAWSDETPLDFGRFWVREGHDALAALARLRQPVIACIKGHCFGGGLELAACADLRIAEEQVKIGQPEAGLGIIPGWSGTQRAVRRFGAQTVRRMAVIGETFTAGEALKLGIVDHVVETGTAMQKSRDMAVKIAARGPVATEITKMLVNAAEGEERERVLEGIAGALAAGTVDLREGVSAFAEKRPPKFEGR